MFLPEETLQLPKPTEAELEILNVLWKSGPATVRSVHEALSLSRQVGYTTILKQMQIMLEKGLLSREAQGRGHIYNAAIREKDTQKALLDRVLEGAFGGSAFKLVMQALGNHNASKEERDAIRQLLDEMEGDD